MFRATRDFIAARGKHTQPYGVAHISHVKKIGGGIQHQCYQNATSFMDANSMNESVGMWSGWLVQPYDEETKSTLILAHWWNIDKNGVQIDTTPLADDSEYVQDYSLQNFCVKNEGSLSTHIAHSLLYKGGSFFLIVNPESNEIIPITELTNEALYRNKFLYNT